VDDSSTQSGRCFACGSHNPVGLKLQFSTSAHDTSSESEFVLAADYAGWGDIAHGGIVATVLDEAMVFACRSAGLSVVTGELRVRYRKPVHTGVSLHVRGELVSRHGALVRAAAEITQDGTLLARGEGRFMELPEQPGTGSAQAT
jgi:uncharacterized protein (TIGR00369 family)